MSSTDPPLDEEAAVNVGNDLSYIPTNSEVELNEV